MMGVHVADMDMRPCLTRYSNAWIQDANLREGQPWKMIF